jgi:hypothetical protein
MNRGTTMTTHHLPKLAWATGLFAITMAHAATGFTVTPNQETQVVPGMSSDEVRQALGKPESHMKFHNEPGPTWTYRLIGNDHTLFDVDFGADGKVASTSERLDESADGGP